MLSSSPVSCAISRAGVVRSVLMLGVATGMHALLAGCATAPVPRGSRLVVTVPAEFYSHGPAQDSGLAFERSTAGAAAFGPDFQLAKGATVTMIQREFGFSKVRTEAGDVGYVANDRLRPAPVIARAAPPESPKPRTSPSPRRTLRSPRLPVEQLDLSDIPLPLPS